MSKGYLVFASGVVPLLTCFLVDSFVEVDRSTADVMVRGSFFLLSLAFVTGTTMVAYDKGYPIPLGFLLGLVSPLGLLILTLLPRKKRVVASMPTVDKTGVVTNDRVRRAWFIRSKSMRMMLGSISLLAFLGGSVLLLNRYSKRAAMEANARKRFGASATVHWSPEGEAMDAQWRQIGYIAVVGALCAAGLLFIPGTQIAEPSIEPKPTTQSN